MQDALSARLTEQVMTLVDPEALFEEVLPERGQILAVPLTNAVEGFVGDQVDTLIASDAFERLWVGAIEIAHEGAVNVLRDESEAVTTDDGQVTLNLIPIVNEVLGDELAMSAQPHPPLPTPIRGPAPMVVAGSELRSLRPLRERRPPLARSGRRVLDAVETGAGR